jgi:hypothetical protein
MLHTWDYMVVCVLLVMGLAGVIAQTAAPGGLAAVLLRSAPFWLLPALGLAVDQVSPAAYQRWREALLLLHRVLVVLLLSAPAAMPASSGAAPPWSGSVVRYGGLLACFDAVMFKVGGAACALVLAGAAAGGCCWRCRC